MPRKRDRFVPLGDVAGTVELPGGPRPDPPRPCAPDATPLHSPQPSDAARRREQRRNRMGFLNRLAGIHDVGRVTISFREDGDHRVAMMRDAGTPPALDASALDAILFLHYTAKALHTLGSGPAADELRQHIALSAVALTIPHTRCARPKVLGCETKFRWDKARRMRDEPHPGSFFFARLDLSPCPDRRHVARLGSPLPRRTKALCCHSW